jgi:NADH-quinone oxidoreductase subunit F
VPGFIALVRQNRIAEALRLHRERNPFAAVCARVCFHTCEDKCRRGVVDEALSIRGVKRFMVDEEVTTQLPEVRPNATNAARKIAIVGAGPAGLSCAYFLARLGYQPRVFEGESRPGGMPVQTIPAYRLPREILSLEVRMIERMGVTIETNQRLGRDFTLQGLRDQGFEVVFLGVGAPAGVHLGVPGEDIAGVDDAIRFLREYNIRGSAPIGNDVVVVGGGNAAIDTARSAIRLGARSVTVLYRRTREEMPAYAEEIEEAEHEGVVIKVLTAPVEIVAKRGRVSGVKCQTMTLGEFDRSGRRRPKAATEEPFVVPADQVITAIGQMLEPAAILDGLPVTLNKDGFIAADSITGRTSLDWLFSGGDAALGPASVVEAVAGGERAAVAIDAQLTGAEHAFWRKDKACDVPFDTNADPVKYSRAKMGLLPVERRRSNFNEVEQPWTENIAVCEAKRCLRCDYREKN